MISIKNVHKYFNRRKNNEIHVINGTTLDFPNTGLVCLLGASGSGKTTLLNVIGGLDKIDSGEINFKDYTIKKYKASKWDYIRNRYFGYIFQNYILLQDLTVYQNLELVLKILNIDKDEIDQRIDYALDAVGMLKFKKRKPTQLSGGQQQRVAIARALVKSPDAIIADEPTGNLDEKNTTQIMNIIKKLSKECLVILVTHERRLAEFYGDRIIEISDGKVIKDVEVTSSNDFQEIDNHNIYLQDLEKEEAIANDLNIKYFYKENRAKLDLNIIFKDNTFYIHSPKDNIKIKFLDRSSEIKVIDSKKPVISKQNIEEFDYHLPKLAYKSTKETSAIKFIDSLKMAFRQLASLRRSQKLLFIVMFLSTIMVTVGFINLFSASYVSENDFLYFNRNIVATTHAEYNQIESSLTENEKIIAAPDTRVVNFLNNGYFNQKKNQISLRHITEYSSTNSLLPIEYVDSPKLIHGKLPTKNNEAVMDKYLVDYYLKNGQVISAGIKYPEQFIGLKFSTSQDYKPEESTDAFTIVGIIDNKNPNIYIKEAMYKSLFIQDRLPFFAEAKPNDLLDVDVFYSVDEEGELTLSPINLSELNIKDNQILVNSTFYEFNVKGRNSNKIPFNNTELEVVGVVFTTPKNFAYIDQIFFTDKIINDAYDYYVKTSYKSNSMVIYSKDMKTLLEKLETSKVKASSLYDREYDRIRLETMNPELVITSIVILSASLVFLYFLIRSSMMSRIYQIGVYRALGIKKLNIYKIFFTEILVITLITAALGLFAVSVVVNKTNEIIDVIHYPWYIAPVTILFMLVVNGVVGLLPINTLLRLTPSQILSKYDI